MLIVSVSLLKAEELCVYRGKEIHEQNNKVFLVDKETKDTILWKDISKEDTKGVLNTIAQHHLQNLSIKKEIAYPENIPRFNRAWIITILLVLTFLINIPFYIRWAKKQEGSREVLLYNVEGKFTYLSIILWIERLEELFEKPLKKERARVEQYYNIANKGNKSIKIFKRKIHDLLLIKAFGPKMIKTAFNRMAKYTRYTYVLDIMVYVSILYTTVMYISINQHIGLAIVLGVFVGNIIAAPSWLICHLIFNGALKKSAKKEIKAGRGAGMRIIMAQFYGAFGGVIWKDLYYIQGRSSWTFGSSVRRKGFGSRIPTASYKSGYSANEVKKEMDFDKDPD